MKAFNQIRLRYTHITHFVPSDYSRLNYTRQFSDQQILKYQQDVDKYSYIVLYVAYKFSFLIHSLNLVNFADHRN